MTVVDRKFENYLPMRKKETPKEFNYKYFFRFIRKLTLPIRKAYNSAESSKKNVLLTVDSLFLLIKLLKEFNSHKCNSFKGKDFLHYPIFELTFCYLEQLKNRRYIHFKLSIIENLLLLALSKRLSFSWMPELFSILDMQEQFYLDNSSTKPNENNPINEEDKAKPFLLSRNNVENFKDERIVNGKDMDSRDYRKFLRSKWAKCLRKGLELDFLLLKNVEKGDELDNDRYPEKTVGPVDGSFMWQKQRMILSAKKVFAKNKRMVAFLEDVKEAIAKEDVDKIKTLQIPKKI